MIALARTALGAALLALVDVSILWWASMVGLVLLAIGLVLLALARWGADPGSERGEDASDSEHDGGTR